MTDTPALEPGPSLDPMALIHGGSMSRFRTRRDVALIRAVERARFFVLGLVFGVVGSVGILAWVLRGWTA